MSHGSGPRGKYSTDRKARIRGPQDPRLVVNGARWQLVEREPEPAGDEAWFGMADEATPEEVRAVIYDRPDRSTVAQMMRSVAGASIRVVTEMAEMIQEAADRVVAEAEAA